MKVGFMPKMGDLSLGSYFFALLETVLVSRVKAIASRLEAIAVVNRRSFRDSWLTREERHRLKQRIDSWRPLFLRAHGELCWAPW